MTAHGNPFDPGLLHRLPAPPRKVALLRASRIGDFICAGPALRSLRAALPGATITMITLPMLRDLVERSPCIDRFVPFPGYPGLAEQLFDPRRTVEFFRQMQAEAFDLAVQMQGSGVYTNPFTLMLGARQTAGYVRPGDGPGRLDAALPLPEAGHEIHRVLAMATFLGAAPQGEEIDYPLLEADHLQAARLVLGTVSPLIGLHPAARDPGRRWPFPRFVEAGKRLRQRYGGTLLILGGPEERETARALAESVGPPVLNLAGRTSLGPLGGIIGRLALLVTNDSGPAHIAYALGTPTVTIFGAGSYDRYRPLQAGPFRPLAHPVPCEWCDDPTCAAGHHCLQAVTVDGVLAAAEASLAAAQAPLNVLPGERPAP